MADIRTVLGRRDSADIGRTLVHEHALVGFPGWFLDTRQPKYNRDEALVRVAAAFEQLKDYGVSTVIDPCPSDLGRDVEFYAEISQRTGVQLVCAAGVYFENAGLTYYYRRMEVEEITDIFIREIEDGVGETGIRPGIVKIASGKPQMTPYERKVITAAARAAKATGVPVLSHTEDCHCGHDQIDLVTDAGVAAENFLVGHSDGMEDIAYQESLAQRGVFVGFDRFGIESLISDDIRMRNLQMLVERGYRDRVMMSHDYVNCWLGRPPGLADGVSMADILPNWNMTHIFENILPALKKRGMSEEDFDVILRQNPQRFFSIVH